MRKKRLFLWTVGTMVALLGILYGAYHFILDWNARPICHKAVMTCFHMWMSDQGMPSESRGNNFPNINGKSVDSLATLNSYMGDNPSWAKDYSYVPGLRENDPGDLVLMYINRPTRWTWHGSPPTIFKEKAWIIVPADFTHGDRPQKSQGELSESVSQAEFQNRLRRTLDFIRTNQRPNWETVVAEHTKFLDSIQH